MNGVDSWYPEYLIVTDSRGGKAWRANFNGWIYEGRYKGQGKYGPLYEIVTVGHEIESEVELYFFADNKMARRKKRVNLDLARRRNT